MHIAGKRRNGGYQPSFHNPPGEGGKGGRDHYSSFPEAFSIQQIFAKVTTVPIMSFSSLDNGMNTMQGSDTLAGCSLPQKHRINQMAISTFIRERNHTAGTNKGRTTYVWYIETH